MLVAVGPHGSTTPRAALGKLKVDCVVMGECEATLLRLANGETETSPGPATARKAPSRQWRPAGRDICRSAPVAMA